MLTPFERGLVATLVADWLLQNDWMARNKTDLRHPAAWVHSAIHGLLLGLALGWLAGLVLAAIHLIVDTRRPMMFWQKIYHQTSEGPMGMIVKIVADQVLHIIAIAAWVEISGRLS